MNGKKEYVGAVEYAEIEDGGVVRLPNGMFDSITRNDTNQMHSDCGELQIETLGNDTYRIKKIQQDEMPMTTINLPERITRKILAHINDDQIKRKMKYTSVEDFIFSSIESNIESDIDCFDMK